MSTWDENVARAVAQNRRNAGLPPQDPWADDEDAIDALENALVEYDESGAICSGRPEPAPTPWRPSS